MSGRYKGLYRNDSLRLRKWDYGWNKPYMVTLTTKNRSRDFGTVINEDMVLSSAGKIAADILQAIPEKFPWSRLGEWIVMPDHVHVVIIISKPAEMFSNEVSVAENARNKAQGGVTGAKNPMLHENLSRIVRWYKGRTTFEIHKIMHDFQWQSRFYDRIVWDRRAFDKVSSYIRLNPKNWKG